MLFNQEIYNKIDCHICKTKLNLPSENNQGDFILLRENIIPVIMFQDLENQSITTEYKNKRLINHWYCPICLMYINPLNDTNKFYITKCGHGICEECKYTYVQNHIDTILHLITESINQTIHIFNNQNWLIRLLYGNNDLMLNLTHHDRRWIFNWLYNLPKKPYWFNYSCRFGILNNTVMKVDIFYIYHFLLNTSIKGYAIWIQFDDSHCKLILIHDLNHCGYIYRGKNDPPPLKINDNEYVLPIWIPYSLCKMTKGYWKYNTLIS